MYNHSMKPDMNFLVRNMLILLVTFMVSCADSTPGVKVEGKLQSRVPGAMVTLNKFDATLETIDTIYVDDDSTFGFYVNPQGQTYYRLNFYGRQQVDFILEGSETVVTINAHGTDPNGISEVSGSKHTDYISRVNELMLAQKNQVSELNQQAIQARMNNDEQALSNVTDQYYQILENSQQEVKAYIKEIVPSIAGFYALNALDPEQHFEFYDELAGLYGVQLPDHPMTIDLLAKVDGLRKLAIGANAPEISLPSPSGEVVTLSSLKGNYVLVDFWAAWCRPCRAENPNVVRMYNQYQSENFEILGVSLDRNREAWVKAIEADGLPWKHVSDLKYFNSEAAADYRINSIPATYLIDPEGKILAKGLRGPTLAAKLKEIFG